MHPILDAQIKKLVQAVDRATTLIETEKAWKKNSFNKRYAKAVSHQLGAIGKAALPCNSMASANRLVMLASSVQAELYTSLFVSNAGRHVIGEVWERAIYVRDAVTTSLYLGPAVGLVKN